MTKFEVLIITGKLEVCVTGEKELFDEVKSMQKYLIDDDLDNLAISLGKLDELLKSHNVKVCEYLEDLINYCVTANVEMEAKPDIDIKIEHLDWPVRSYNCLRRAGFHTVRAILELNGSDICSVKNLGKSALEEIIKKMQELGFDEWACRIRKEIKEIKKNS